MSPRGIVLLAAAAMLGACNTVPLGPSVSVFPGGTKSLEQFQAEDTDCRAWATRQLGSTSGEPQGMTQRRYDIAYQQCMYVRGNQVPDGPPAATGGARIPPPPPAPPTSAPRER